MSAPVHCSFCGRGSDHGDVFVMISAPAGVAAICDGCIAIAFRAALSHGLSRRKAVAMSPVEGGGE